MRIWEAYGVSTVTYHVPQLQSHWSIGRTQAAMLWRDAHLLSALVRVHPLWQKCMAKCMTKAGQIAPICAVSKFKNHSGISSNVYLGHLKTESCFQTWKSCPCPSHAAGPYRPWRHQAKNGFQPSRFDMFPTGIFDMLCWHMLTTCKTKTPRFPLVSFVFPAITQDLMSRNRIFNLTIPIWLVCFVQNVKTHGAWFL